MKGNHSETLKKLKNQAIAFWQMAISFDDPKEREKWLSSYREVAQRLKEHKNWLDALEN